MSEKRSRREFLTSAIYSTVGVCTAGMWGCAQPQRRGVSAFDLSPVNTVRIGIVGVGSRGTHLLKLLTRLEGVEIRAVCDVVEDQVTQAQQIVKDAGQAKPAGYSHGDEDYRRLCLRDDLDLVVTATPWSLHTPVSVCAMKAGKHAAPEVPAAVTAEQCQQLVETSERTRRHCVMLENCCYGRVEMMILRMVREGLFGELLHGEAGYLHDLRRNKFHEYWNNWRLKHSMDRNGNLYPTHGLGPIAQYMNINRGDRFDYLVSMSSKSRGLQLYAKEQFGPESKFAKQDYSLGDVNVSLIRTVNGKTIYLAHNCNNPRPYSRLNMIQGTKGIFRGYPDRIYLEGRSPQPHTWQEAENYFAEYEHPLWKELADEAAGAGHGGMDYMELYRLIKCLREGIQPDMDVYDAASWSVVSELTERSVANKSEPVDFPDYTRGKWKSKKPLGIVEA